MNIFDSRPKRKNESLLMEYLDLIVEMRSQNYTFREIKEYIESKFNIKIGSLQNLMKFFKRHGVNYGKVENYVKSKPTEDKVKTENINILTNSNTDKYAGSSATMELLGSLGNTDNEQAQKLIERRNRNFKE